MFLPNGDGTYLVLLPVEFRQLLRERLQELRNRLMSDQTGGDLQRLYPTAYNQHAHLDEEYQRLMRSELQASRLAALDSVEQSLDAVSVTTDELNQWMQSVNALRLVLGTMLDIGEEPTEPDPDDPQLLDRYLYDDLNIVLSTIVEALRAGDGRPRRKRFGRR